MSIKRIIEIESAAYISCLHQQLLIKLKNGKQTSIPIEDIGFLILDNSQITHTQYLLATCLEHQVAIVICDDKHLPAGVLMPLCGHTLQSRILQQQANINEPIKHEVWRQIISAKITAQQNTLNNCAQTHPALNRLAKQGPPADPQNCEAQAARIYFSALFGQSFRRDRHSEGVNTLLNYGYTLLRAACARALIAAGMHPTLGIHHRNQYDSMCLADDIMEPLRPMIDAHVHAYQQKQKNESDSINLDRKARTYLISWLSNTCNIGKRSNIPLMVALEEYVASIRSVLFEESKLIKVPAQ